MKFEVLDLKHNKNLTEDQQQSIEKEIHTATCFEFPGMPFWDESLSAATQLAYIQGYVRLTDCYGKYADTLPSDFAVIVGRPSDDRGKVKNYSHTNTDRIIDTTISYADYVIETLMMKELLELKQSECIVTLQKEDMALDVSDKDRLSILSMLDEADFQEGKGAYIERIPYVHNYSSRYVCSTFAPFAHLLLELKPQTKRTDATKERGSAYFLGRLSLPGESGIDFSQYFTMNDYWFYEMETGVNLSVELADALLVLRDQKIITDIDIPHICFAIRENLSLTSSFPIITRIHLLRSSVQYMASYMRAVRQHPESYIAHYDVLKSPVEGSIGRTFDNPIEINFPQDDTSENVKFTGEELAWVLSEMVRTLGFPFYQFDSLPVIDEHITNIVGDREMPTGYVFAETRHPKCALAFCNRSHKYIDEYASYISGSANGYSKNSKLEQMFIAVHSALFEAV